MYIVDGSFCVSLHNNNALYHPGYHDTHSNTNSLLYSINVKCVLN